jgi:ribosomal protein L31E
VNQSGSTATANFVLVDEQDVNSKITSKGKKNIEDKTKLKGENIDEEN